METELEPENMPAPTQSAINRDSVFEIMRRPIWRKLNEIQPDLSDPTRGEMNQVSVYYPQALGDQ